MISIGVVIIGRNEGARLVRCIESVVACCPPGNVVYVDSGSTDDSVQTARNAGVNVIELDTRTAFSAARARNAGFAVARVSNPCSVAKTRAGSPCHFVQFIDGDCQLQPGWLHAAQTFLEAHPDTAVVCGRRRERHPEASIFNRLCDMEWNTPIGQAKSCGGDALIRASALQSVGGYRADVMAAEDDEVCLRLRRAGWKILRIDAEMTLHDADMHHLRQWWRRSKRAGQAYAHGYALHGRSADRHFARDCARILCWGLVVAALAILPAYWTDGLSLLLLLAYPALVVRIYLGTRRRGSDRRSSAWYALFTVIAKFPALVGLLGFHLSRLLGRQPALIEHKQLASAS